jgi:hypothetical protein
MSKRHTKAAFRRRAQALGVWSTFVAQREQLKQQLGFTADDVLRILIPEFEQTMDALETASREGGRESHPAA